MNKAMVSAVVAAAVGPLVLTACGGGSTPHPAATAAASPSTAAATSSPPSAAAPAPAGVQAPALRAALLPPDAFGTSLVFAAGSPGAHDYPDGIDVAPSLSDTSCDRLFLGGSDEDARSYASALLVRVGHPELAFAEAARRYDAHGAETLIGLVQQQAHACATQTTKASNGKPMSHHLTLTPKPGLGDAAYLVDDVTTLQGYPNRLLDGLIVRYGDIVITISVAGAEKDVHSYDLTGKVRALAHNLHLG